MARCAIILALIVSAAASALPAAREKTAPYCDPAQCVLPDCRCSSLDIPGGLTPAETPQVCFHDSKLIVHIKFKKMN